MSTTADDPFDSILSLEDQFYNEGYDLGVSDGNRAGLIEGRSFGLEKGFEKYGSMGKLYGRAVIWTGRLPASRDTPVPYSQDASSTSTDTANVSKVLSLQESNGGVQPGVERPLGRARVPGLPANIRLEKHVRTLYALTEPESLSTNNDEKSISEFDDRFNRAEGKIKVIEKLTGVTGSRGILGRPTSDSSEPETRNGKIKRGDGGIEDISSLHARH